MMIISILDICKKGNQAFVCHTLRGSDVVTEDTETGTFFGGSVPVQDSNTSLPVTLHIQDSDEELTVMLTLVFSVNTSTTH